MEEDSQRLPKINELPVKQRDIALNKYNIIKPFLQQHKSLASICNESKLPLRTAREWIKNYRQNGFIGLVRKARNDKGVRRRCPVELQNLIEGLYLKMPYLSMANIYKKAKEYAIRYNLLYPSYRTCCIIIKQIPKCIGLQS